MNRSLTTRNLILCSVAAIALLALPASASDVIPRGVDGWTTLETSHSNFVNDPIPAGFFCEGSEAFTDRVPMRGAELASEPAMAEEYDTLIERLDDARFDAEGVAYTRLSFLALHLESIDPLQTSCGEFDMRIVLDKEQQETEMMIVRESEHGGYFAAPLAINARMLFTPVAGGDTLELRRSIQLAPGTRSFWADMGTDIARGPEVRVDTDDDGVPDRLLPPQSNFKPGVHPAAVAANSALCKDESCHCNPVSTDPWEPNWACHPFHKHCIPVIIPCEDFPIPEERGPRYEEADPTETHTGSL